MKNKMLILSLFLALTSLVKNVNSMNYSLADLESGEKTFTEDEQSKIQEFINKVNDAGGFKNFLEETDHREEQSCLIKCIRLIRVNDIEGFKTYFESSGIDINLSLDLEIYDSEEADEKENKESNELLPEDHGKTLLMFALEMGNIELIEYLISQGADVNKNYGITPLSIAVLNNDIVAARLLIQAGADVNIRTYIDFIHDDIDPSFGSLLMEYFNNGDDIQLEMVKFLIDNGHVLYYNPNDYNVPDDDYNAPVGTGILEAVLNNKKIKKEIVELIFSYADEQYIYDHFFYLYNATIHDGKFNFEIFEYLIKKKLINIDSIHKSNEDHPCFGFGHLHVAVDQQPLQVLQNLILLGANVNILSTDGRTPLMIACKKGNFDKVKALLNADADVTIQNPVGLNAYDIAKAQYNKAKAERNCKGIYKYAKVIRILDQWNKSLAKEVIKAVPDFPNEISGLVVDILTNSNLKTKDFEQINEEVESEKKINQAQVMREELIRLIDNNYIMGVKAFLKQILVVPNLQLEDKKCNLMEYIASNINIKSEIVELIYNSMDRVTLALNMYDLMDLASRNFNINVIKYFEKRKFEFDSIIENSLNGSNEITQEENKESLEGVVKKKKRPRGSYSEQLDSNDPNNYLC